MEKLPLRGEPVRCLVRRRLCPPGCRPGVEAVPGDLVSGQGLEDALAGVDTVIHLAGVTKALLGKTTTPATSRATANARWRPLRAAPSAWCTSARWPPSAPASMARRWTRTPRRIPSRTYGKSKLEGERVVRAAGARCRDRAAAGGLRPARYRRFPDFEIHFPGSGRWRSPAATAGSAPFTCDDLVDGLLAAARAPARARAAPISWLIAKPNVERPGSAAAAASWGEGRACCVSRTGGALAVGYCAEMWSRLTRKARHRLARESGGSAVASTGPATRAALPPNSASQRATPLHAGLAERSPGTRRPVG